MQVSRFALSQRASQSPTTMALITAIKNTVLRTRVSRRGFITVLIRQEFFKKGALEAVQALGLAW